MAVRALSPENVQYRALLTVCAMVASFSMTSAT